MRVCQHGTEPGVLHADLDRDGASHVAEAGCAATEQVPEEEASCMCRHDRPEEPRTALEHCIFLGI